MKLNVYSYLRHRTYNTVFVNQSHRQQHHLGDYIQGGATQEIPFYTPDTILSLFYFSYFLGFFLSQEVSASTAAELSQHQWL